MSDKLDKHILGIKSLISNPQLRKLSKLTGNIGVTMIDEHTRAGDYYGGEYQNRPYSSVDLPVFFFGDFKIVERTGNIRVNARVGPSNILLKLDEDFYWRTTQQGNSTAYLRDGYAGWLRKTRPGKGTQTVDHTYTGSMLRNLTFTITVQTNQSTIEWYVRPPDDEKAYYTHIRRHWLGFFDREITKIMERAQKFIGDDAVRMLHNK